MILDGPPIGDVAVLLGGFDERSALQVLGPGADRGDLRVAEDCRGHPVLRERERIVGVSQIVSDSAGFGVGDVLQLERRAAVPERPYPRCGSPEVVDDDVAVIAERDPGQIQTEIVGVRPAARGHQQQFPCHSRAIVEQPPQCRPSAG